MKGESEETEQQHEQEYLAPQLMKIGGDELRRVISQERFLEKLEQVPVQLEPVRVQRSNTYGRCKHDQIVPHALSPHCTIVAPGELPQAADEVEADQDPSVHESAV